MMSRTGALQRSAEHCGSPGDTLEGSFSEMVGSWPAPPNPRAGFPSHITHSSADLDIAPTARCVFFAEKVPIKLY
eukprot:scaffold20594_cov27-Tisochrysis_lutea.AAC.1